jgi:hypothetical protein
MNRLIAISAILLLGRSASAHRLDEYLEATLFSLEKDSVQAEMRLAPGVAVSSFVLRSIDTDGDGVISPAEQRAYAERVLREVTLSMEGESLTPRLTSVKFPPVEELKEGMGEIQFEFRADLRQGARHRKLVFENHHQSRIAAYMVNSLVPRDPNIRSLVQKRNEQQSLYQVDYEQVGTTGVLSVITDDGLGLLALAAALLLARLAYLLTPGSKLNLCEAIHDGEEEPNHRQEPDESAASAWDEKTSPRLS